MTQTQIMAGLLIFMTAATILSFSLKQRYPERVPLVPDSRFRTWWLILAGLFVSHYLTVNHDWGSLPKLASFCTLSALALAQFLNHLPQKPGKLTYFFCYIVCLAQYYLVYIEWYGFFVVFIPVFVFLYLTPLERKSGFASRASLHWALMSTVFCFSHTAYILTFPRGAELLFYVVVLTEVADATRLLLARNPAGKRWSKFWSCLSSLGVAYILAPAFTPLTTEHSLLAGLVLGVSGSLGHDNVENLSQELGMESANALERVESLAYTAPLFLHAYRYFDYPL